MRLRDSLTAALGLITVAASVLLVGGAFRWSQAIVAVLVGVCAVVTIPSSRVLTRISPLIATLGAAAALTALQLIPLPSGLLETLQPVGAPLRAEGAELAGVDPWNALSLDAPGSLRALCFFAILIGVAWIALRFAVSESGRYRLLASVAAVCGLTAALVGIHVVFGATSLYGLYTPVDAHPSVLGPLLNENHLGGLMALGTLLAIGLVMYQRQASWLRATWFVVAAACGSVTVASQSRGATLALIAGAVITGAVLLGQKLFGPEESRGRSRERFLTTSLPIGIVALCAIVVIIYASAGAVSAQLSRTQLAEIHQPKSKFAVWRTTVELIEEAPWVGVGRGAFEPAFTRLHPAAAVASFSHVENEYIQAVVDWGVPGAMLLGLGVIWIIVTGARRWRDGPLVAGALGATAAIGLQSIVDFGIELLGVAVPLTVVVATLAYVPLHAGEPRALKLARGLRIGAAVAMFGAAMLLLSRHTTTVDEDHAALVAAKSPSMEDVRASIERHPLDYYGYALAAQLQERDAPAASVRNLNHALRLHPTQPGLHQIAARMLYRTGHREQAAIEYASAIRTVASPWALIGEVLARFPASQAAMALPVDIARPDDLLNGLLQRNRGDVAIAWLQHVLDLQPNDRHACEWLYSAAVHDQKVEEAQIATRRCRPSDNTTTRLGIASLLVRNHLPDEAMRALSDVESWTGTVDDRVTGWLLVCDIHISASRWDDAKRCLRRLDASGLVAANRRDEIARRLDQVAQAMRTPPL